MDPNRPGQYNNQNNQPQPPNNDNDYDFIMNPQQSSKPAFLGPESAKMRIIVFASGVIILIILMVLFFSFLNASSNAQKENLLKVAQTQEEIIRVVGLGEQNITERDLKTKTSTLKAVMLTSKQDTLSALSGRGQNVNPKKLAEGQNPQHDAELESASEQARHDEALNQILVKLLNQYALELEAVYNNGSAEEQEFSSEAFDQVDLIFDLSEDTEEIEGTEESPTSR